MLRASLAAGSIAPWTALTTRFAALCVLAALRPFVGCGWRSFRGQAGFCALLLLVVAQLL